MTETTKIKEKTYPGEFAAPEDLLLLAQEYRRAAEAVLPLGKNGKPLTRAPYRLIALQTIELYLNAFLLISGCAAKEIRGMQHDFSAKAKLAKEKGLLLRQKTQEHIVSLYSSREYLTSRYGAEMTTKQSEITRLKATIEELAKKVQLKKNTAVKSLPNLNS